MSDIFLDIPEKNIIIGVDEAGRGPLAGPVVAAAVYLKTTDFSAKIADSKKLSALQREKAFLEICEKGYYGVGIISERVIDDINILEATFVAMNNAIANLVAQIPKKIPGRLHIKDDICLLIDGNQFKTDLPYRYQTIIDGDALDISIACASIVAKVLRDRILNTYDKIFPEYGFSRHKGYPTMAHKKAIEQFGLSTIHRRSFNHL